jgi:hypothetical protein
MNREQLLKKMLAIKAYLDRQKEMTRSESNKKSGVDDISESQGNMDERQTGKKNNSNNRNWTKEWEDEIKKELNGERRSDIRKVVN